MNLCKWWKNRSKQARLVAVSTPPIKMYPPSEDSAVPRPDRSLSQAAARAQEAVVRRPAPDPWRSARPSPSRPSSSGDTYSAYNPATYDSGSSSSGSCDSGGSSSSSDSGSSSCDSGGF